MDVARLVLDYLRVITWPLIVLVCVLLFRKQLAVLIGRIKKFSGFGIDVEMESRARRVGPASEAMPELAAAAKGSAHEFSISAVIPLAGAANENAPAPQPIEGNRQGDGVYQVGRVLSAWADVNSVAATLSEQLGQPPGRAVNVQGVVEKLKKQDRISDEAVDVVRELQQIRNQLIQDPNVVLTTDAADSLLNAIRNLVGALTHISTHFDNP